MNFLVRWLGFLVLCLLLVACATTASQSATIYGIPRAQWNSLSKQQQRAVMQRYAHQKEKTLPQEAMKEKNWHEAGVKSAHIYPYEPVKI